MLHKINLPHSWIHLSWIVAFQHRLLKNLCLPTTQKDDVTIAWVQRLFPKLDEQWVTSFCNRKHEEKRAIDRMRLIVGLDNITKAQLISDFKNDMQIRNAFQPSDSQFRLRGLAAIRDEVTRNQIRRFFESFYDPYFYRNENNSRQGYYIPSQVKGSYHFHNHEFIAKFKLANKNLNVCPFCDGPVSSEQLDHFYAKKHHPFLSCHPLNLVPICGECNKDKLEALPIDNSTDNSNPFFNWFHPYLFPLCDCFLIDFIRDDRGIFRPVLIGEDDQSQIRLLNLRKLLNLDERYAKEYERRVNHTKDRILGWLKHHQRKNKDQQVKLEELVDKLELWAAESPIGREQFCFLAQAYFRRAATGDKDMYGVLRNSFVQAISQLNLYSNLSQTEFKLA